MQHSTGLVLYMYDAKFINSGAYTCEVIVDTTFDTLMFTKKMMVIGKCISVQNYEGQLAKVTPMTQYPLKSTKKCKFLVIGHNSQQIWDYLGFLKKNTESNIISREGN